MSAGPSRKKAAPGAMKPVQRKIGKGTVSSVEKKVGPWRHVWNTGVMGVTVAFEFCIIGSLALGMDLVAELWADHGLTPAIAWLFKGAAFLIALLDVYMLLRYVCLHAFRSQDEQ